MQNPCKENIMNDLIEFEQSQMAVFKALAEFKTAREKLDEQEKKLKADLEKAMLDYGIKSFSNDYVTLSYIDASSSETIDLKAFKENEPTLYNELLCDYKKVTNKKAYVRILVK
jgi:pantothenate kinase-related protein Tda10